MVITHNMAAMGATRQLKTSVKKTEEASDKLGSGYRIITDKDDAEAIQAQLQAFLDEYNRNQPTYRRITGLVVRKNPFIRNTTKKIRRQDVLIDEPLE